MRDEDKCVNGETRDAPLTSGAFYAADGFRVCARLLRRLQKSWRALREAAQRMRMVCRYFSAASIMFSSERLVRGRGEKKEMMRRVRCGREIYGHARRGGELDER